MQNIKLFCYRRILDEDSFFSDGREERKYADWSRGKNEKKKGKNER